MWFRRYLISWNLVHTKSSTFKVTNDQCCSFYFSIVGISGWTFKHWLKASNIALCLRNVNFVLCHIVCNQIYFLHATACVQRPAQKGGGGNQAAHICPPRFCKFKRFLKNIFSIDNHGEKIIGPSTFTYTLQGLTVKAYYSQKMCFLWGQGLL